MAGIYIHVPFCKTRCVYCDFYSTTEQAAHADAYVQAVCTELELRKDYLQGRPVQTVYLGGGTPSQLSVEQLERLLTTAHRVYGLAHAHEITLEANPDDLTPQYLHNLGRLPINRLSIGIQTFDDHLLRLLKRRHTAAQAIETVEHCRRAGFSNVSIDLIYGLPGQSMEHWQHDLQTAISLNAEHISAYHLIYEAGTPLYDMLNRHAVSEADEEDSNRFFALLMDRLGAAGYEHYEISNFGRPGRHSHHNSSYWNGTPYLGCGPSAHSFDGKNRAWNAASLALYIKGVNAGRPPLETEILDPDTRHNDRVITALRTRRGLCMEALQAEFGDVYARDLLRMARKHLETGLLELVDNHLRLTRRGIFVSDGVMSDLLRV